MKILQLLPYIYADGKGYSNNVTGFGYMVSDISESIASLSHDVGVYTHEYFTSGTLRGGGYKNYYFVPHRRGDVIKGFFSLKNLRYTFFARKYSSGFKGKLQDAFFFSSIRALEKTIKKFKPNIAHIHSVTHSNIPFLIACVRTKTPFVVTLHGLLPIETNNDVKRHDVLFEKQLIEYADLKNLYITTVSQGVKDEILRRFDVADSNKIIPVINGNRVLVPKITAEELKKRLKISNSDKIILCVGSLCKRKNQAQIIEFLSLAKSNGIFNITAIFIGSDSLGGELQKLSADLGLSDKTKFIGTLAHCDLGDYYNVCDVTVLLSLSEGFPGSLIESSLAGKPIVCFNDLAGSEEFDLDNGVLIPTHDTSDVYVGILQALDQTWDYGLIKQKSEKFSLKLMAEKYCEVYKKAIKLPPKLTEQDVFRMCKNSLKIEEKENV